MKILKKSLTSLFVFLVWQVNAQDFPYHYFSHSLPVIENPSLVAARADLEIALGAYNLWAGGYKPVNDYLLTISFSPETGKQKRSNKYVPRVGVGMNLLSEHIGPFTQYIMQLMYGYHIPLSQNVQLSLGISGMVENLQIDVNSLSPGQPDDPRLIGGSNRSLLLDGGFGATVSDDKFSVAFSALNLAPGAFRFSEQQAEEISSYRRFFLSGNYSVSFYQYAFIRPQVTLRNSRLEFINYDLSLDFGLRYFEVGAGYRSESSLFLFVRVPVAGFLFSYTSENPMKASYMAGNGHAFTIGWKPGFASY